jgi:hypothetical protein
LIIDDTGEATRFLKYQNGAFLLAASPDDMNPENLRQSLIGSMQAGATQLMPYYA